MKVFEANPAKGKYFVHAQRAGTVCFLFLAAGIVGLAHVAVPAFLPEFISRMNARINLKLNQRLCECKD